MFARMESERLIGTFRALLVPLLLAALLAAVLSQSQAAEAATVGRCQDVKALRGSVEDVIWNADDHKCYGLYLKSGYTYTFQLEMIPKVTGDAIDGYVYHQPLPNAYIFLWAGKQEGYYVRPNFDESNFEMVSSHLRMSPASAAMASSDPEVQAVLTSLISYTYEGTPGSVKLHVFELFGYLDSVGGFRLSVTESVSIDPTSCRTIFDC